MIGYLRVSTEDQALNGVSLQAQRSRIEAHAVAHGYELVGIEADEGISGKIPPKRRRGLSRALEAINRGAADGLVFLKLDRVSRSVRHILALADEARSQGWHLMSLSESIDTSTAAGKFTLGVLALLAEMERDQIGERTAFGLAQVAREGRVRSRFVPFGYRVKGAPRATTVKAGGPGTLVEHPLEIHLLRRIMRLADNHGSRYIATFLNGRGVFNPRTGAEWNRSTVAAIIRTAKRRARLMAS